GPYVAGPLPSGAVLRTYAAAGAYVARLRVTDDCGAVATDTASVNVHVNLPPVAVATVLCRIACRTGSPITCRGSLSTDADGAVLSYNWDFDGDGTYDTGEV